MRTRLPVRILPAAIIGAGLLLAGKLGVLWLDHGAPARASGEGPKVAALATIAPAAGTPEDGASAEGAAPAKEKPAAAPKDSATTADKADGGHDGGTATKGDAAGEAQDDAAAGAAGEERGGSGARLGLDDESFDPMMLSRAEIELLQGLSKRREALEARERDFALKEQTLAAAEQKLDAKIKALEELKKTVEALLGQHDKQEEERLGSLVKIYESMKPKEAAAILEGLEQDTLLDVIERMKESKSAAILALFNPARAKMITEEMIARRRLPKPEGNS